MNAKAYRLSNKINKIHLSTISEELNIFEMSFPEISTKEICECYQVNLPFVVYETFADQETAIINLKTGNYYSLNVSGAEIWEKLAKNIDVNQIISELLLKHEEKPEFIRRSIDNFVADLKKEDLIVEFNEGDENGSSVIVLEKFTEKTPFIAPIIEGYTDMQELLLLDPIHDVDETGFPNAKQK